MADRASRYQDMSDEDLMVQYVRRDERAFEVLLSRYQRPLLGFLFRYLRRHDKAEDVFQEVFFEVIRARSRFEPQSKFKYWLFRIARNRAVDRLRRNGFREMDSLDALISPGDDSGESRLNMVPAGDPDPEELVRSLELNTALEKALSALPPEQREVFWLKEQSGLTFIEIAEMTGVSPNTVKSRLRYALEKIRSELAERGFGA